MSEEHFVNKERVRTLPVRKTCWQVYNLTATPSSACIIILIGTFVKESKQASFSSGGDDGGFSLLIIRLQHEYSYSVYVSIYQ